MSEWIWKYPKLNYLPEETVLASTPECFRNYISP